MVDYSKWEMSETLLLGQLLGLSGKMVSSINCLFTNSVLGSAMHVPTYLSSDLEIPYKY